MFRSGCHNISTTETTEKMDCKKLSVTEWLNKTDELPLIGMMVRYRQYIERKCWWLYSFINHC